MKIYLCTKCNKTIPLTDLVQHRKQCGYGAEFSLKRSKGKAVAKSILFLLLAALLAFGGIWLGKSSFKAIATMREVERIPATVVNAVLPGEVNLNGQAMKSASLLKAPDSGTSCIYYRYKKEREETDSDGDSHWVTVEDRAEQVGFTLTDDTGSIAVDPRGQIKFSMPESHNRRSGSLRYTEWRIDPGDQVFILGYAVGNAGRCQIRFNKEGHYTPIISKYDESHERLGMAWVSIFQCWGGLVCLAFAVGFVVYAFRGHKLLVYFSILSLIIVVDLFVLGTGMMKADLRAAVARLDHHEEAVRQEVRRQLSTVGGNWDDSWDTLGAFADHRLNAPAAARLERIRLDFAVATRRVQTQRNAFPERILAPAWGIPKKSAIPLPAEMQTELDELAAAFEGAKVPPAIGWGVIGGAFIAAALSFAFGFRKVRFKRCIENLPTTPTAGASYGMSEFKGIVTLPDDSEPLQGPVTNSPCVQYHYVVKERRRHGKKTTWVTVIDESMQCPFLCEDGEGSIWVAPQGAQVMSQHRASRRSGRYHYIETRLELNDPLYAIGECVIEPVVGDSLYLTKPQDKYPFILSNFPEDTVMRKIAAAGIVLLNIAFAAILLLALVMFGLTGSFAATDYLAAALAAPLFMTLVTLILHFNDLVFLRERASRNWSNIDVSLQKRHDLVPNLEKMVKAYMSHESGVMQAITDLRTAYGTGRASDTDGVSKYMNSERNALAKVLAVYEDYPDLKASGQSAYLMRQLIVLENEIGFMRNGYNDAVETYNTRIQTLPDLVFAKLFHFKTKDFIQAESTVMRVPPSIRNLWDKKQVAEQGEQATTTSAPPATDQSTSGAAARAVAGPAGMPVQHAAASVAREERPDGDAASEVVDAHAVIYALLLSDDEPVRKAQLETIAADDSADVKERVSGLIDAVRGDVANDLARLRTAEEWFDKLQTQSQSGYAVFKKVVRKLIEQDDFISLFEYALQKSMTRRLDSVFGMLTEQPIRHTTTALVVEHISMVLSRLAHAEEQPAETRQEAFALGVENVDHRPKTDLTLMPEDACTLAAFDHALEELARASHMIKANVLRACIKAVEMNGDFSYDQGLLMFAMADAFGLDRPDWPSE